MTVLQSLALKLVMLAVTVTIVYWALENDQPKRLSPAMASRTTAGADVSPPTVSTQPAPPVVPSPPVVSEKTAERAKLIPAPTRRRVTFPINLNAAKLEDLMELPGIGETLASRIMAYRRTHGKFRSVEDLRHVKGIGKKRMDRLRPLLATGA
jgi:competence protein ComEA